MNKPLDLNEVKIYSKNRKDIIKAMDLLGEEFYLSEWVDFSSYVKDKLTRVIYAKDDSHPYWCSGENSDHWGYRYAVLAKDVKTKEEKNLRPYKNIEEFFKETELELGMVIRFRKKDTGRECTVLLTGYTNFGILLGAVSYEFRNLMDMLEYYDNDTKEWKPFGVEE